MNTFEKYIGQVFDNRYKITDIIGVGGMAVVFKSFDLATNRIVAVKMLKDEISNDSQSVKRFINESKAVSMLSHPNIVSIYDVSVKDNLKYIVMEYVDGITLKNYIRQKVMQNSVIPVREAISYTEQILRALEHAHSKGIIHRDIKPQNIMLLKNGKIKVTDFGIAKLPNAETLTMTDKAIGTVHYISPEQAEGKPIDRRSDLYSLGAAMYEMLTGKLPFDADTPVGVALKQISEPPVHPREYNPGIPRGLEQIVLLAMEKDPARRFQNATQMLSHLIQIKNNPSFVFKTRKAPEQTQPKTELVRPVTDTQSTASADAASTVSPAPAKNVSKRKKGVTADASNGKKSKYSLFPIVLGVFTALLVVIGISAFSLISPLLQKQEQAVPEEVTVPNVVGHLYNEKLGDELNAQGFRISIEYDNTAVSGEPNKILEQRPAPGETKKVIIGKQYADLNLVLSIGEGSVRLPDLLVKDYREVESSVKTMGLTCKIEYEFNDNIRMGRVIRTNPTAGSLVPTGSVVTIYVSNGPKMSDIPAPQLLGLTEEEARAALDEAGISLGSVTSEPSDKEKGIVIAQNVNAYETINPSTTKINIVISSGNTSE